MFARYTNKILNLRKKNKNNCLKIDDSKFEKRLPKDTVSLHETTIDMPDHPIKRKLERRSASQPVLSISEENLEQPKKSVTPSNTTTGMEWVEKQLITRYCCGCFNVLTMFHYVALGHFFLDCIGGFVAYYSLYIDDTIAFLYAIGAMGELINLCLINAVQEERIETIQHYYHAFWGFIKFVFLFVLYICNFFIIELIRFSCSKEHVVEPVLIFFFFYVPFCMGYLCLYYFYFASNAIHYIEAREIFYVIPSARRSAHLRKSAQAYLDTQKSKDNSKV